MPRLRRYLVPALILASIIFICGKLLLTPVQSASSVFWLADIPPVERGWPWVFHQFYEWRRHGIAASASNYFWWLLLADLAVMFLAIAAAAFLLVRHYRHHGRWLQISLRGMLLFTALVCVGCAWFMSHYTRSQQEGRLTHSAMYMVALQSYCGPEWLLRFYPDRTTLGPFLHVTELAPDVYRWEPPELLQLKMFLQGLPQVTHLTFKQLPPPSELADPILFSGIETLTLPSTQSIDKVLEELPQWPRLRALHIGYRQSGYLSDRSTSLIARCAALEELQMSWSDISDVGVGHLTALKRLHTLDLYSAPITDAAIAQLVPMTLLRSLDIGETQITDAALEDLAQMPSLVELFVSRCPYLTDDGIRHLLALPNLKSLYLPGPPQISEETIQLLRSRIENVFVDDDPADR